MDDLYASFEGMGSEYNLSIKVMLNDLRSNRHDHLERREAVLTRTILSGKILL